MKSLKPDLVVANIDASVAYYRDVLGFEVVGVVPGPDGKTAHAEVRRGNAAIMFDRLDWLPESEREHRGRGLSLYCEFGDEDIDAYYELVRARGATISHEIANEFWGHRHFAVTDPDGFQLSFAKALSTPTGGN